MEAGQTSRGSQTLIGGLLLGRQVSGGDEPSPEPGGWRRGTLSSDGKAEPQGFQSPGRAGGQWEEFLSAVLAFCTLRCYLWAEPGAWPSEARCRLPPLTPSSSLGVSPTLMCPPQLSVEALP